MAPKPSAEPTPDLIRIVLPTLPGGRDEANIVIDVTRGPSIHISASVDLEIPSDIKAPDGSPAWQKLDGGSTAKRIARDALDVLTVASRTPSTIPDADLAHLRTVAAELSKPTSGLISNVRVFLIQNGRLR